MRDYMYIYFKLFKKGNRPESVSCKIEGIIVNLLEKELDVMNRSALIEDLEHWRHDIICFLIPHFDLSVFLGYRIHA